jgi:hypothetical protein
MTNAFSLVPSAPTPGPSVPRAATVSRVSPVMVTLNAYGSEHEWGPVNWMTPDTPPVRGAAALALIDDTGSVWAWGVP